MVVLDTSAVTDLASVGEQARARLRGLRQRADDVVVPAAVLAEGVFSGHAGRDFHVHRLLQAVRVGVVDEGLGRAAGEMRSQAIRAGADPAPSGVDAIVAATADSAGSEVLLVTSDVGDMKALLAMAANREHISIVKSTRQ